MSSSPLLLGPGSVTQAQAVAFTLVGAVFLALLTLNLAVCRLYRRAIAEPRRQARREQKKRMSDVWVYHVHRTNSFTPNNVTSNTNNSGGDGVSGDPTTSTNNTVLTGFTSGSQRASQQILRKLHASHESLRASLAASAEVTSSGVTSSDTYGEEESQALEELNIAAELFLHDVSNDVSAASSRRSSLGRGRRRSDSLPSVLVSDLDLDLDPAVINLRLDDKVSLSSVTMADFENDEDPRGKGGKRRWRRSKRRSGGSHHGNEERDREASTLPVAEFHNEAFDFAESTTALETVKDVDL